MKKGTTLSLFSGKKTLTKLLMIMRLTLFLMVFGVFQLQATLYSQDGLFTLNMENTSMRSIFKEIEKQSELRFFYNDLLTNVDKSITVNAENLKIDQLLNRLLEGSDLTYKIMENNLVLISPRALLQQKTVNGRVTAASNGDPLPGVNVIIKGTSQGTVTDVDGNYSIVVASDDAVLVFSFIGYLAQEIKVGSQTGIDVSLAETVESLDEIVVIGYGSQRKGDVTASIASVKSEDFIQGNVKDAGQLLQGKVAGLNITNPSGDPNAEVEILLRGYTTLNGIRTPYVIIDGIPGGDLKTVAPQDIESIDVLKDGSAAAIYGTRGTNGVIIITTKTGRKNQPMTLTYNTYVSTQQISRRMDMLDASDYQRMADDTLKGGLNISKKIYDYGYETDWVDEITRTPVSQMHNITLTGGADHTTYTGSFNYNNAQGIFLKSSVENYKVRMDISQSMFKDILTVNLGLLSGQTNNPSVDPSNAYYQSLIRNPTDRVKDTLGNWQERDGYFYYNPVALLQEDDVLDEQRYTWMHGVITLVPIKGLTMKLLMDRNVWNSNWNRATTFQHQSATIDGIQGIVEKSSSQSIDNILEFTTEYAKVIGSHSFSVLGGYSYSDNFYTTYWVKNQNFPTDVFGYYNIPIGKDLKDGTAQMSNTTTMNKLIGFIGRVNYSYAGKYLFQASLRREGSSKFGPNNQWGNFPAVQVGWRISEESFMNGIAAINDLKIRIGYGVTGIEPIDPYLSLTSLEYDDQEYFYYDGEWIQTLAPNRSNNPDLKWESKSEVNLGLDLLILNNRINGSIDLYQRTNEGLIDWYNVPSPPYPATTIVANAGKITNKGIEVLLNAIAVKGKNFVWNTGITFSMNKNKLVSLSNDEFKFSTEYLGGGYTGEPIQAETHRVYMGEELGTFWGYKVVGAYPEKYKIPGSKDVDSIARLWIDVPVLTDPVTGEITQEADTIKLKNSDLAKHRQALGNGIPKYYLSWNNTFTYKSFDLGILMRGAFGFEILNFADMFYGNTVYDNNNLRSAYDKVETTFTTTTGEEKTGYYLFRDDLAVTSWNIEPGGYWKIDNVTLGYTLHPKKNKYLKSLRVYFSGLNLYTFTNYTGVDPEVTRDIRFAGDDVKEKYPTTRVYTIGLDVTF